MAVQTYARVVDGVVEELWPHHPTAPMLDAEGQPLATQPTPVEVFGAAFGALFLPCNGEVQQGWTTADGGKTFAAPAAPAGPPLASIQAGLSADIDRQAEAQRLLYITPGEAQMATYLLKRSASLQALAAQAANTAANMTADALATAYPYLANEIGLTLDPTSKAPATDVHGVARAVQAVAVVWQQLDLAIERIRLATKASIAAATTAAAAQAAHNAVAWPAPPSV